MTAGLGYWAYNEFFDQTNFCSGHQRPAAPYECRFKLALYFGLARLTHEVDVPFCFGSVYEAIPLVEAVRITAAQRT